MTENGNTFRIMIEMLNHTVDHLGSDKLLFYKYPFELGLLTELRRDFLFYIGI